MSVQIEKVWTTKAGLRSLVAIVNNSHRCGYVEIPQGHKYFGADYDDVAVSVHGELTYADTGNGIFPGADESTWFLGYDCAHAGDGFLPGSRFSGSAYAETRSLEYCVIECESLAEQLQEISGEV